MGNPWTGFKKLHGLLRRYYFGRLLRNTLLLGVQSLIFGFPAPIILALLLSEVGNIGFKRTVQTITYLPHFISLVVIFGMILRSKQDGVITYLLTFLTVKMKTCS